MQKVRAVCLVALLAVVFSPGMRFVQAAPNVITITVNTTDDELNSDGDCSLREALRAANLDQVVSGCAAGSGADTVEVPAGTYVLTLSGANENEALTGDLDITSDVTISGVGADLTVIDGNASDRIFEILADTNVSLSNLQITNGSVSNDEIGGGMTTHYSSVVVLTALKVISNSSNFGGGIHNAGVMSIANATVEDNQSNFGVNLWGHAGGIANTWELTISNSTIRNNHATLSGGGILSSHKLTMTDTLIENNEASDGAGANVSSTAMLTNVTIRNNQASGSFGGGIHAQGGLRLVNSLVEGNSAGSGGGIHFDFALEENFVTGTTIRNNIGGGIYLYGDDANRSKAVVQDSLISGNNSYQGGGGIENLGDLTLENTTLDANTGDSTPFGTIENLGRLAMTNTTIVASTGRGLYAQQGTVRVKNTIIQATQNCVGGSYITSLGNNLGTDQSCGFNATGDMSNTDPLLGALQDNGGPTWTRELLTGSPAIDAGANKGCPTTDQRGVTRPQDANGDAINLCDIGAYEVPASNVTTVPTPIKPKNKGVVNTNRVRLDWTEIAWVARYQVELYKDKPTGALIANKQAIESKLKTPRLKNGKYVWRVRACNDLGCSDWTPFRKFTVAQ